MAQNEEKTRLAGRSLANSLYNLPLTIALRGELGAGKTTFLQGFAHSLGINDTITSPTYALEQRYASSKGDFLHLDLYRLSEAQARQLLLSSDHCTGIRAIEWSERVPLSEFLQGGHVIVVDCFEETSGGRKIEIEFHDALLPTRDQIDTWRRDVLLPAHIVDHCEAVATFSAVLADALIARGQVVRKTLLTRAAELHDLLRFLDFRPGGHPDNTHTTEHQARWTGIAKKYADMHHEMACAAFLRERGFSALASVIAVHGMSTPSPVRSTIEEKLLYYADKRVMLDRVVSLQERFADFATRYGSGTPSEEGKMWFAEAQKMEEELFPEGAP